jgi:dienelactone hydrolase
VKSQGGRLETHIYAGADHAWDRIDSKKWDYNEEVDKDSHKMTIEFFKKHLE